MRRVTGLRVLGRMRSCERGYTLTELIVVMTILLIVLAGITGVFVSASQGQADLQQRFEAQEQARLALDKLRRELHCASDVSPTSGTVRDITITLYGYCATSGLGTPTSSTSVTWCVPSGSTELWRIPAASATCATATAGSTRWAANLTTPTPFTPAIGSGADLDKISVQLHVDTDPSSTRRLYRLEDDIVLRNSSRT
jgi:prepilin-type N-terminal cleavage/methylation domain-containing protein